eukprot:2744861-Rhodomonas_salina.1
MKLRKPDSEPRSPVDTRVPGYTCHGTLATLEAWPRIPSSVRTIRGTTYYGVATDGIRKWSRRLARINQCQCKGTWRPSSPVARRASNWAQAVLLS